MRAFEFLHEASVLNLSKLTKRPGRVDKFLSLISQEHEFNSKNGPVVLDPTQINSLQSKLNQSAIGSGTPMVKTIDGDQIPMSNLYYDEVAWSSGPDGVAKGKLGDTGVDLKPSKTFGHGKVEKGSVITPDLAVSLGAFLAGQLGDKIQASEHLDNQGAVGIIIKQMSKEISNKQLPTIPPEVLEDKKLLSSVQNDAFEYLGVQELVNGVANFPNDKAFYEHLGAELRSLVLFFPGSTNHALADSFALVNKATENTVYMSSKGGKQGGAPSSINELKIPDAMKKSIGKDPALSFINHLQTENKPMWRMTFEAANWLHENSPGSLGALDEFLPFDDEFYLWASTILSSANNGVPTTLDQIPEEYRGLYTLVQNSRKNSTAAAADLFWNLKNVVKTYIHGAVNNGAVPQFSERMIELLGQNFVLLKSKPVNGKMVTDVTWPSKMGGKITLEHKDGPTKWNSAITWKLS
jgi:hypothetical protein